MTVTRGGWGGEQGKGGEGASQGTGVEDSWARTMGGMDCGRGGGWVGRALGKKAEQL